MQLDGEYQLKGTSNEQLKEYTVRQYEELVKDNKKQLDHLKSLKKFIVNPEEVNKLDEQISDDEYPAGEISNSNSDWRDTLMFDDKTPYFS